MRKKSLNGTTVRDISINKGATNRQIAMKLTGTPLASVTACHPEVKYSDIILALYEKDSRNPSH